MSKLNSFHLNSELEKWDKLKEELILLFKIKEDMSRKVVMEKGMVLLATILEEAEVSPINFKERFEFIKSNLTNYTAFRQLDELFKETKKKIASKRILEQKER